MALAIVVLAVATALPAAAAPAQEGGDGLRAEAATSFVVDPAARLIRASTEMTVTNEMGGGYYFFSYSVPVLAESANHRAVRADGQSLTVSVDRTDDAGEGFVYAEIRLRPNVLAGQSLTFRLDYEIPFQPPRAKAWSRGNDAVVAFPAFSPGDPGLASMEVRVPKDYEVEVGGSELDRTEAEGQIVLTAAAIDDPETFTAMIVATRENKLVLEATTVDNLLIELEAWPDDTAWIDYIGEQLDATMPTLQDLVGQPWPDSVDELVVVESLIPAAHGYGGWYDPTDGSITMGDEFDPVLIAHELSHVWFNDSLFKSRWINEGLAEEYAQTTLATLHLPADAAVAPDRSGPGAVDLNDWTDAWSFEDVDDLKENYGYAASWYVLDQIAAEVGEEEMREVIAVAADHEITYVGDPEREKLAGTFDWRALLDLLEIEAGSTKAAGLFDRFVVNDEQRALLATRGIARESYAGLVERGDGWTPPLEVRRAMSLWDFEHVDDLIAQSDEVLELRADIEETLDGLDVGPLVLEESYESAADLDDVAEDAQDTLDAARDYRDAQKRFDDASGSPLEQIGLLGTGTAGHLNEARADLEDGKARGSLAASEAVEARLDAAVRNGLLRVGGALIVVAIGLWRLGRVLRRRRARRAELRQLEAMYAAPEASGPASETDTTLRP
jgi:hypothetical protein